MDTGSLNKRIQIEKRGQEQDAAGQPVAGWVPHVKLWANIRHVNGVQTIKAGAPTTVLQASMRIRYRTDVDESMRVIFKGKVYEIKAAIPDEVTREHVDLVCEVLP